MRAETGFSFATTTCFEIAAALGIGSTANFINAKGLGTSVAIAVASPQGLDLDSRILGCSADSFKIN